MRVNTDQNPTLADAFVQVPPSDLDDLNTLINWEVIHERLREIEAGYCALTLFKSLLLQSWHGLSDRRLSQALSRDIVYMQFCGLTLDGHKPDYSTICRFRNRLIQAGLLDELLGLINDQIESRGMKLSCGKYISCDATLIRSARRARKRLETKVEDETYEATQVLYSDDEEASWVKKGDQLIYGYAGYVCTDEDGLVDVVHTAPANNSEQQEFKRLLDQADLPEGKKVLYDKGVASKSNRDLLKTRKLRDGIMRKKPRGKPYSPLEKRRNSLISQKRFVTERTFGTLKRTYGLHRARYISKVKVHAEIVLKSIAYNLRRAMNRFLSQPPQQSCA